MEYLHAKLWTEPLKEIHFPTSQDQIIRIQCDFQKTLYLEHRKKDHIDTEVLVQRDQSSKTHSVAKVDYSSIINLENDGPHLVFSPDYECRAMQLNRFHSYEPTVPQDSTMIVRCIPNTDRLKPPSLQEQRYVQTLDVEEQGPYWNSVNVHHFNASKQCYRKEQCQQDLYLQITRWSRIPGISQTGGCATFKNGEKRGLVTSVHEARQKQHS